MTTKHIAFGVLGVLLLAIVIVFAGGTFGKDSDPVTEVTTSTIPGSTTTVRTPEETGGDIENPEYGTKLVTAALGQGASALDATVTPLEVVEDSRCPSGANCIVAGRVRVKVRVQTVERADEAVLAVGETVRHGGLSVTLTNVTPYPQPNVPIAPNQYRFTFAVQR